MDVEKKDLSRVGRVRGTSRNRGETTLLLPEWEEKGRRGNSLAGGGATNRGQS